MLQSDELLLLVVEPLSLRGFVFHDRAEVSSTLKLAFELVASVDERNDLRLHVFAHITELGGRILVPLRLFHDLRDSGHPSCSFDLPHHFSNFLWVVSLWTKIAGNQSLDSSGQVNLLIHLRWRSLPLLCL